MQTVGSIRAWTREELERAGVDSPLLTADLLIGFVLGWNRVRLLSHAEDALAADVSARVRELVRRRIAGEPLQYLTGEQEFFGLAFKVTPDVLIPRPETEILVEEALRLMKLYPSPQIRFADICTGSGCIAISVAHQVPFSTGCGVDISPVALKIARENATRHGVTERLHFVQSDLLDCFPQKPFLDFVLCNPPYIAFGEYDSLPREVRNHEPHRALFGGESGVVIYAHLIPGAASRIVAGGYLVLEVGFGQANYVGRLIEKEGFSLNAVINDLQGIPRCIAARKISQEQ